jgi:hypothetical protein
MRKAVAMHEEGSHNAEPRSLSAALGTALPAPSLEGSDLRTPELAASFRDDGLQMTHRGPWIRFMGSGRCT